MLELKRLIWAGTSRADVAAFPQPARREAGHDLWRVQAVELPRDWRPMADIGPGVIELRVHAATEHRVLYVARFQEGVYVLHAFEKRSRKTSRRDLETARSRYRAVLARRRPAGSA